MTWLLNPAAIAGSLLLAAASLRLIGMKQWADVMRAFTRQLEAARVDGASRPSMARYDAGDLQGLPAPVQRYFRAALTDGQPVIAAATIEMAGTINMSATSEHWKPFTSRQRVITKRPGFLWDAKVSMFPGLPVRVVDSYIAGQGRLIAKLLGLFTVADASDGGELARGELMRYFAEAAWYPTALLPSQGVRWEAVDDASANATLVDGQLSLTLLFRFGEGDTIASVHAESRGAGVGRDTVMRPWDCSLSDYQLRDRMSIPMVGEAAWVQPGGRKAYFVGKVSALSYEFMP